MFVGLFNLTPCCMFLYVAYKDMKRRYHALKTVNDLLRPGERSFNDTQEKDFANRPWLLLDNPTNITGYSHATDESYAYSHLH